MTASTDSRTPVAAPAGPAFGTAAPELAAADVGYIFPVRSPDQPLLFKKRKLLPHPQPQGLAGRRHSLPVGDLNLRPGTQALKHQPRRIGAGPDPPPTPPAHSRNSSSTHSAIPSSPTFVDTPDTSTEDVQTRTNARLKPKPRARASNYSPPRTPKTPPIQRSPPTPDVTPPQIHVEKRPRAFRPPINDRIPSKATTDSRTESFKTAPENPYSSEEEDGRSTLRAVLPSMRTSSQSTVRQANGDGSRKKPVGLGLGLESSSPESNQTPQATRPKGEFISFDGEWGDDDEVEQVWDDNLARNVVVRKRRPGMSGGMKGPANGTSTNGLRAGSVEEVVEEVVEDNNVAPTNATQALRSMCLPGRILTFPSPQETPTKKQVGALPQRAGAVLEPSPNINVDVRRFSGMSSKSTVSTVVEAILVETPPPKRQNTLRHVRKQNTLRDSGSEVSPSSSVTTSAQLEEQQRGRHARPQINGSSSQHRHQSYASTNTTRTTGTGVSIPGSIASRKARREVWKSGAIPVVVVPDRRSSVNSHSRTPSLRSTSSRRSKRSHSLSSAPLSQISPSKDLTPYFERPARRGRRLSESDGSAPGDQRTMDYPPIVPVRRSSLSAPTSRNASRAGSLTASSLSELDALHTANADPTRRQEPKLASRMEQKKPEGRSSVKRDQRERHHGQDQGRDRRRGQSPRDAAPALGPAPSFPPEVRVEPARSDESMKAKRDHPMHKLSVDHHGDPLFGKRLSAQRTPFSMASVETNATSHAEVSEAMAVNIYPHQGTSVQVVDHSTRPSESSDASSYLARPNELPSSKAKRSAPTPSDVDECTAEPVTPPQPVFSMDDVDSPLRNPRAPPAPPPEPPAIQFIPATPSGLTPTQENYKQLGNFYEEIDARPPMRRPLALVRRALSGRRHSEYVPSSPPRRSGLLTRAFSLSRGSSLRRATADRVWGGRAKDPAVTGEDDRPADETRLHPHWRPARSARDHDDDDAGFDDEDDYYDEDDRRRGDRAGDDYVHHEDRDQRIYRYPRIDNRPSRRPVPPRRSLSERLKRTFAILPLDESDTDRAFDESLPAMPGSPIRRTVRRTTSGNLRVVRHRDSLDSLVGAVRRPYTAPDDGWKRRSFWRSPTSSTDRAVGGGDGAVVMLPSSHRRRTGAPRPRNASPGGMGRRRLSSLIHLARDSGIGLHSLPRRISERRREKRSAELRRTISAPREVRDGVGDVIRRSTYRDAYTQANSAVLPIPPRQSQQQQQQGLQRRGSL